MRQLPGGVWYEPSDLGIDGAVLAASANVVGNIIPWRAGFPFTWVSFGFEIVAGPSADFSLDMRGIDADGQTFIDVGNVQLVANMLLTTNAWFSGNSATARALSGAVGANAMCDLMMAAYARFRIVNNDGVNGGTVSLRAHLAKT